MPDPFAAIESAAKVALERCPTSPPRIGVVLGSGLGRYAESLEGAASVAYADLPSFPAATVHGHSGRMWFGSKRGVPVVVLQGRIHLYEGRSPQEVVFPIRALGAMGIRAVCLTNAAGGIRQTLRPGALLRITDHLNLTGQNPLVGANDERRGPRFPDLSRVYDEALGETLVAAAAAENLTLYEGVYAQLLGPSYETPAEVRMLRLLGADAVGMSTVLEAIAARHLGVRVAGVSCITNLAAGGAPEPLSHAAVEAVAAGVERDFARLIDGFVERAAALL